MASMEDQLQISQYVHSPLNLNCFAYWAQTADEEELDEVMQVIYTVEHRMGGDWGMFPTQPIGITRPDLGRTWTMGLRSCQEENCQRCISGRGG